MFKKIFQKEKAEVADKYNDKYNSTDLIEKISEKISEKIDFGKSKIFEKLYYFTIPNFDVRVSPDGNQSINGRTLINELILEPTHEFFVINGIRRRDPITVLFKNIDRTSSIIDTVEKPDKYAHLELNKGYMVKVKGNDPRKLAKTDYTKANCAVAIIDYEGYILPPKEFEFVKNVAREVQKEIIKDKDYINLNMKRKIYQEKQNRKKESGEIDPEKLEKVVGKKYANELMNLDQIDTSDKRFPVHAMNAINQAVNRPKLYESANYFPY